MTDKDRFFFALVNLVGWTLHPGCRPVDEKVLREMAHQCVTIVNEEYP